MKEDILEQIVEDYLIHKGYFVQHNVKYRPIPGHGFRINKKKDSNYSDIDVVGVHPKLQGPERVLAVSCKSWQQGFDPKYLISRIEEDKKFSGRKAKLMFRELCIEKWSYAFKHKIQELTGADLFTYVTAVTVVKGEKSAWETYKPFQKAMADNPIKVLTLKEMIDYIDKVIEKTPEPSDVGRMLQVFRAAGLDPFKSGDE